MIAYFLSVKPGNVAARKLHYRMVRTKITNEAANDEMWSTDDSEEDEEEYDKDLQGHTKNCMIRDTDLEKSNHESMHDNR